MSKIDELMKGLSEEERQIVMKSLKEIEETGQSSTLTSLYEEDYEEIPVSIDEFIENPRYAGWMTDNGKGIYPYWRERLREIFSPNASYQEVAFSGSIGIGKSSIAILGLAYQMYKLMCLKDPHSFYKIGKGGNIYIVFFNATLTLSQGVAYTKFQNLLQNSPWFMERGTISGKKYIEYIPNKPIRFTVGSTIEHSLGKDIFCGIMDEVNFVKGADIHMEKSKIMKTYNSILERMGSRFMIDGKIAGCLFVVSSKKSEHDFIEQYIQKKKGDPGMYLVDAPLWDVKPQGTYCGKKFKVAVGGSNMVSKIIGDDEDPMSYVKQGYSIIEPPIEFKGRFEMDLQAALMNIAGISVTNVMKFIVYNNLVKCYTEDRKNPFMSNIISIGLYDDHTIKEFFLPSLVPEEVYSRPIFIHLDMSVTGDRTGISAIAAMGKRYVEEFNLETSAMERVQKMVYYHVFTIGIQCPAGSEISLQKNRDFIYYLRNELGWNIKSVSTDGFQSVDTRQSLINSGIDAKLVSLDRTPDGYLTMKAAINEKRISMLCIPELEIEFIELERDNMTGKVDHPIDGSKDMADSVAGALYNAFLNETNMGLEIIDDASHIIDVNKNEYEDDDRANLLANIISQVKNAPKHDDVAIEDIPDRKPRYSDLEERMDMDSGILMF